MNISFEWINLERNIPFNLIQASQYANESVGKAPAFSCRI